MHSLTLAYQKLLNVISSGYDSMSPYLQYAIYTLIAIDLTWFGILVAMGKYNSLADLVRKALTVAVSLWVLTHFTSLARDFLDYLTTLMSKAGSASGAGNIGQYLLNPVKILDDAHTQILSPIDEAIAKVGGVFSGTQGLKMQVTGYFVSLLVFVCFTLIALQLIMATLEFHIVVVVGAALLPFTLFEPVAFIGKRVYETAVSLVLKLAVVGFISSISVSAIMSALPWMEEVNNGSRKPNFVVDPDKLLSLDYLLQVSALSMLAAGLAFLIPSLASSLVTGSPGLSLQSIPGAVSALQKLANLANPLNNPLVKMATSKLAGLAGDGARSLVSSIKTSMSNQTANATKASTNGGGGGSSGGGAMTRALPAPNMERHTDRPMRDVTPPSERVLLLPPPPDHPKPNHKIKGEPK